MLAPDFLREIPSREAIKGNLSFLESNDEHAIITFTIPDNGNSITFELQRYIEGWKISGGSFTKLLDD